MEKVLWDFKEKGKDKAKVFQWYHLNSRHSVRTQSFHAPKMDYKIIEDEVVKPKRELVWEIPCLEDIEDPGITFREVLLMRRTSWDFKRNVMTEKEMEQFLAFSFGINQKKENLKTYPSGGRLYPIEVYLIPTKKSLGQNQMFASNHTLFYDIHTRRLEKQSVFDVDQVDSFISATDIGGFSFDKAQFLICMVGNPQLMLQKYHSLTYRLMHDECGHMGQNLCLTAAMLQLNVVPLGGFFEQRIMKTLELSMTEKELLYVFALG